MIINLALLHYLFKTQRLIIILKIKPALLNMITNISNL